jgi:hypothetical protein
MCVIFSKRPIVMNLAGMPNLKSMNCHRYICYVCIPWALTHALSFRLVCGGSMGRRLDHDPTIVLVQGPWCQWVQCVLVSSRP